MPSAVFLCDLSGVMARPWADAGYDCVCYDLQHSIRADRVEGRITYRWADVRSLTLEDLPGDVRFSAAFPPCTHGAVSGARDWKRKGLQGCIDWLTTFEACRRLVACLGCPWMIEQPVVSTTIASYWREPDQQFHPSDYGDPYTKRTNLWTGGGFVMPEKNPVQALLGSRMHTLPPGPDRANQRSVTPAGFSKAVFEANHP